MKQSQALWVLLNGQSVFLTGAPGAGKSYVLNKFVRIAESRGKTVAVTASTGIAATHIGGMTIHSWSGIGIREQLTGHDVEIFSNNARLKKRYLATDILIIDEVSMLSGKFLNMINQLAKLLRESDKPFGGLQVVLVGDMFQLPPVNRSGQQFDFAFESDAWDELSPQICYLTEQHRQTGDELLAVLEAMRSGEIEDIHRETVARRLRVEPDPTLTITRLYAHNMDVDTINQRHLAAIDSEVHTYEMSHTGAQARAEQLQRGILAPAVLELKVGAEVMFVANDFAKGFANGSRGHVVDFYDDEPIVQLASNGKQIVVEPHTWSLSEDGKVRAEVSQLPLRLAWAITIHKSQGMSLDAAEIDLSRTFTPGMGYVALSRLRSIDGVFLKGVNQMAFQLHPAIFELDVALRQASAELALSAQDYIEEAVTKNAGSGMLGVDTVLLDALKAWRTTRANEMDMPAYIVAHNTLLEELAKRRPLTPQQMLGVKGMGKKKYDQFGEELLAIITAHDTQGAKT